MARRKSAERPNQVPNVFEQMINYVMREGKKSLARRLVNGAFTQVGQGLQKNPAEVLDLVLEKLRPAVEVKSRRVGGSTYQVPMEVSAKRGDALALRWLCHSASQRKEKGFLNCLAAEANDILAGRGGAMKKREDIEKMALANQAFASLLWK